MLDYMHRATFINRKENKKERRRDLEKKSRSRTGKDKAETDRKDDHLNSLSWAKRGALRTGSRGPVVC